MNTQPRNEKASIVLMPETAAQVIHVLKSVNLAIPHREGLMAISRLCRDEFRRNIYAYANRQNNWEQAQNYLKNLCDGMSPAVLDGLHQLHIEYDLDLMVSIAKREGSVFALAVAQAIAGGPEAASMMKYIKSQLQLEDEGAGYTGTSEPKAAAPTQPDRQVAYRPEQRPERRPDGMPEQSSVPVPAMEAKDYHVYGGKGALTWSRDINARDRHTIRLEGAPATGPREYDWSKKIAIQLGLSELPMLHAVLYGDVQKLEGQRSVNGTVKSFSIENQGGKFFVKVQQKDASLVAVPMTSGDAVWVSCMVLQQCIRNAPGMTEDVFIRTVKALVARGNNQH